MKQAKTFAHNVFTMPAKAPTLYPNQTKLLKGLGERLRDARLRRRFSVSLVAQRADVSRPTINKVEHGEPAVTLGTYLRVLTVLGLEKDLAQVAADHLVTLDQRGSRYLPLSRNQNDS